MQKFTFKCTVLSIAIYSLLYSQFNLAEDFFDPSLIEGVSDQNKYIDLSVFNKGGQAEGTYLSEIYLNSNYVIQQRVRYSHAEGGNQLLPALSKADYVKFGVLPNATPAFMNIPDDEIIKNISTVIPDAFAKYNFEQNRLDISIPQQYVHRVAQGTVAESQWDDGISALFANYNYSGASTKTDGISGYQNNSYLNLRSGLNIGPWRLRNYSIYSHSNHTEKWQNINTYVERDIKSIKGRLVIGDSYTPSDMFDSFSFRGAQLASDDAMQPTSLRGFAPVVRGIAQSNAQITIRQNGSIIWQSYVPPGPFMINDLYPTAASGDLEVTIKEADGTVRTFIQPFSSVPIMLREGRFKYSLTVGEYRSRSKGDKTPSFLQATGIYGLPYTSTIYSGVITSKHYNSLLLGLGKSLGDLGSISFDATIANAKMLGENNTGGSFRFQYSKEVLSTGTSFSLAGYRYSTSKYRDFSEANGYYENTPIYYSNGTLDEDEIRKGYAIWRNGQRKRDRLQLSINQTLGDYGSLYVTGYQQQYWSNSGKERSLNLGYNKSYKGINYSFNYSYSKDMYYGRKDQTFSLTMQIPLDFIHSNTWLNLSTSSDDKGNNTTTAGISGTVLEDNNLSYNLQQGYTNRGVGSSGGASVDYKASFGEYQVGYNYTRYTQQVNYSAMGGIVVHPHGVTFSQPLGETIALVRAKDADNVKVIGNPGISTDRWGNAIVPYVSPYQRNDLSLDTSSLGARADISTNTRTVVPTRGAIVLANYPTSIGYKVFVTLQGVNIPFGAKATVSNNGVVSTGIVDDGQKVYLNGAPIEGTISVSWADGHCEAPYKLVDPQSDIISVSVQCN